MSKQNTFPDYENLNRLLATHAVAQSLEEVIEYVRMAAILCHNDFSHPDDDAAPAPAAPVLH